MRAGVSDTLTSAVAETHGSERRGEASDAETVNRGDWSVRTDACTPARNNEHRNQESLPTIVDVGERDVYRV